MFEKPDNIVVAYPEQEKFEIAHGAVRAFSDYCRSVKAPSAYADRASFDPFQLRPWLGYIMILDTVPESDDFRYRMYGTRIAEHSGFDMTGKLVSAFDSPVGKFFADLYRECVAEKCLIYSVHSRVHARFDCDWHRLMCPARAGDVVQIVACNYPVARQKPRNIDC